MHKRKLCVESESHFAAGVSHFLQPLDCDRMDIAWLDPNHCNFLSIINQETSTVPWVRTAWLNDFDQAVTVQIIQLRQSCILSPVLARALAIA